MSRPVTLFLAVSDHGFGHFAQLACVIQAWQPREQLHLVIASRLPESLMRGFLPQDLTLTIEPHSLDIAMIMHDALRVDASASLQAYQTAASQRDAQIQSIQELLRKHQPDLIIGNIPRLVMPAAAQLGIPSAAVCSLDWAGVLARYCAHLPHAAAVIEQVQADYAQATALISLTPGMGFRALLEAHPECESRHHVVGPVSRRLANVEHMQRAVRDADVVRGKELVLVSMGGMPVPIPYADWPQSTERVYVIAADDLPDRADMCRLRDFPYDYLQCLYAADVFISKLGYGAMLEAACAATPTLYLPRGDWPEEPFSVPWYEQHMQCVPVTTANVMSGEFEQAINTLRQQPSKPAVVPDGAEQVVDLLQKTILHSAK